MVYFPKVVYHFPFTITYFQSIGLMLYIKPLMHSANGQVKKLNPKKSWQLKTNCSKMIPTIINDEISDDINEAFSVINAQGFSHVELRTVFGKNIIDINTDELEELRSLLRDYQLQVSAISSPIFKSPLFRNNDLSYDSFLDTQMSPEQYLKISERTRNIADFLDADYVRFFSFIQTDELFSNLQSTLTEYFRKLSHVFADKKPFLLLENEHMCYLKTGRDFVESGISEFGIGLLWDPANSLIAGSDNIVEELSKCKDYIRYVHVKNFQNIKGRIIYTSLNDGIIDYKKLIAKIGCQTTAEYISIETHCVGTKKRTLSIKSMNELKALL